MITEHTTHPGCGVDSGDDPCALAELPDNPFVALRVVAGMLLGESDFRVMLGSPRGKLMLHSSWLHGAGVLWGLPVHYDKELDQLAVGPGLAVDGRGRELRLETGWCVTVGDWVQEWSRRHPAGDGEGRRRLSLWVVIEPCPCLDRKVPALADPCDVTRRHDDYSRVVEQARIRITDVDPTPRLPYPRVRALLGLVDPDQHDAPAVQEGLQEAADVVARPQHERARALLAAMRRLAALDVTEVEPARPAGSPAVDELYPVTEDGSAVVLAGLQVDVTEEGGCVGNEVHVDPTVRRAVLPTTTIQELTCGLAPGLLGDEHAQDAGGPRLRCAPRWNAERTQVRLDLTAPAAPGSEEAAVVITSLSDDGRGWAHDGVRDIRLEEGGTCVVVDLDHAPAYQTVRVIVRGTGRTPLFGADPRVPFAGLLDGPPGSAHDGHDAVITARLPGTGRAPGTAPHEPKHDELEELT